MANAATFHISFFTPFADFTKAEERIVEGIASVPTPDTQGGVWDGKPYEADIIEPGAVRQALTEYMRWRNIREMHQLSAVGKALDARIVDEVASADGKPLRDALYLKVFVQDDDAWSKVKSKIYQGFSLGGKVLKASVEFINNVWVRVIKALRLTEISLVDRPAHPDARFLFWKGESFMDPAQLDEFIRKAADPSKAVMVLQELRNAAELAGEMELAGMYTQAISLVQQAANYKPGAADVMEAPSEMPEISDEMTAAAKPGDLAKRGGKSHKFLSAAQGWALLNKAGRTFSLSNASAMHDVIKALAGMLAGAGDEVAAKIVECYGGGDVAQAAQTADLVKALAPQFSGLETLLKGLDTRVANIEAKPAPGGPVLRPADKNIAGQGNQGANDLTKRKANAQQRVSDLLRKATTEPNPAIAQNYRNQLTEAERQLAALG